jgi:PAS domain S-box-containing protein
MGREGAMPELSNMRVMVVDDVEANIDILVDTLSGQYRVSVAMDGGSALQDIAKIRPDLILLDIMMPGLDGYQVCRKLKADEATRKIPVIFITAKTETDSIIKGFKLGAVDYITKPFQADEVRARVHTHLENQALYRRLASENQRFKTLAEASFEGIFIHDKGKIIDLNREALRLFRLREKDLLGQDLLSRLPEDCHGAVLDEKARPWAGEVLNNRGESVPVEIRTKNFDFEAAPVSVTAIRDLSIQKSMENEKRTLQNENRILKHSLKERYKFGDIIGRSPAMQEVYGQLAQAASSDFHVVVFGESGTGKELVARTIYGLSHRKDKAFVAVNCGAISDSLFEREFFGHRKGSFTGADRDRPGFFDEAHQGTLFLDELGELKPAMQVKLLRVLEDGGYMPVGGTKVKKADARIISATNKDLSALVQQGGFREDLFYRIHVIDISLPPLRDRKEDIPLLADFFLSRFASAGDKPRLSGEMLDSLASYQWPGNVRELQNTMQRFLVTKRISLPGGRPIVAADAGGAPDHNHGLNGALESLERRMIQNALDQASWSRSQAAELLKVSRWTLQRKMLKYGIAEAES